MSIHVFGDTVDEIQRKLGEILPLVDAGVERVMQLHATLQSELADYLSSYESLESSMGTVAAAASELAGDITDIQSEVETGAGELTGGLDEVGEQATDALQHLTATRERVEADIESASSQLQASAATAESQLDSMVETVDSMHGQVTTLRDQAETAFGEVDERVTEFSTNWEQDESKSRESLTSLKSAISDQHKPEVKQKFDGFHANTVETVSNVVGLLTEKDGGMDDFFSAFDTDAETLAEDFKAQTRKTFGELKQCAENECGKAIEESLENLAKEVVEAFAAEIIASVATTQLGVSTTSMLSPIIPELVIAKKVTGVINSIL